MTEKLRCPSCGGPLKVANKRIKELDAQIKAVKDIIESERFNTKRIGIGNAIHSILDDIEAALEDKP